MKVAMIAGNVGKDAVIRRTQDGTPVCGFSVAVSEGKNSETTWFDCSIWGKRADAVCQYITKGTRIALVGQLSTREYNGKTYLQVRTSEFTLLGGGQRQEYDPDEGRADPSQPPALDDEIPF